MKTVIYSKINKKLINDWKRLWKTSFYADYVNSPDWFLSVLDSFGYNEYVIPAVYNQGKLVAIAALVKEERFGVNFYTVAPEDYVCGLPFLFDLQDKNAVGALFKSLVKLENILMDNVPKVFVEILGKNIKQFTLTPYSLNYVLKLNKDSDGRIMLYKRNRLIKKAQNIYQRLTFKSYNGKTEKSLHTVFDIDSKSTKHNKGYGVFSDQSVREFYRLIARNFKDEFTVNILYFDDKPVAYELGFLVGDTYFGSQIAHLAEYERYSLGKVLLVKLIDSLGEKGIKKMDFGSGDSLFKRLFSDDFQQLYKVVISRSSLTRTYLKMVYKSKNKIFNGMQKVDGIYSIYRRTRNLIGSKTL